MGGGDMAGGPRVSQLAALRNGRHPLTGVSLGAASAVFRAAAGPILPASRAAACPAKLQLAVRKSQGLLDKRVAFAVGVLICHGCTD